jgi:YHS domain-containing protein
VLFRAGDYIRSMVNVASRVTTAAMADQILLTEAAASAVPMEGVAVDEVGTRQVRGVEQPIALYRVLQEEGRVDPVCGRPVPAPPAARLSRDGTERWFCSEDCLRLFLEAPSASAE